MRGFDTPGAAFLNAHELFPDLLTIFRPCTGLILGKGRSQKNVCMLATLCMMEFSSRKFRVHMAVTSDRLCFRLMLGSQPSSPSVRYGQQRRALLNSR